MCDRKCHWDITLCFVLTIFLPLGFQEGFLTRSFPVSWGDLCHWAKYPTVLHFPFWLLFSKATAWNVRDFAFSSMADYEKYPTYGRIERILQWIPITHHLDFTINIYYACFIIVIHPSIHSESCIFFFLKQMVLKEKKKKRKKEKREVSSRLERRCWFGASWVMEAHGPWLSQCLREEPRGVRLGGVHDYQAPRHWSAQVGHIYGRSAFREQWRLHPWW